MHYIFLALTNPEPSREDEFNTWYNVHHAPEVLSYGRGFLTARRYRRESFAGGGDSFPWQYLALYEMMSDDLRDYHRAPWSRPNPPLTPFRGLLKDDHAAWIYRRYTPQRAAQPRAAEDPAGSPADRATALVFDLVRVDPGREQAFDEWLDGTHIPRVRAQAAAALAVRRYVLAEHQRPSQADSYWKHLTTYELSGDDGEALASLTDAVQGAGDTDPRAGRLWNERRVSAWTAISECYTAAARADLAARGGD